MVKEKSLVLKNPTVAGLIYIEEASPPRAPNAPPTAWARAVPAGALLLNLKASSIVCAWSEKQAPVIAMANTILFIIW
jgi:hypothetical protein